MILRQRSAYRGEPDMSRLVGMCLLILRSVAEKPAPKELLL
jgi:hypothetical protein